jgi:hypothetical protein
MEHEYIFGNLKKIPKLKKVLRNKMYGSSEA